jgi:glycosyltransferase involved in cell wall biosynthesis
VRAGGPADLIEEWRSGLLCEPSAEEIAAKLLLVAERPALRERLVRGGLAAAAERTWERALAQLAAGYSVALGDAVPAQRPSGATTTAA